MNKLLHLVIGPWNHERFSRPTPRDVEAEPSIIGTEAIDTQENIWTFEQRPYVNDNGCSDTVEGWSLGQSFIEAERVDLRKSEDVYVTVLHAYLRRGGSEEGGWWYTDYDVLAEECVHYSQADEKVERMTKAYADYDDPQPMSNVNSRGKLEVRVRDYQYKPSPRPHYC